MEITLKLVRQIFRRALGFESFVATFIKSVRADGKATRTAQIDREGRLTYSPEFLLDQTVYPFTGLESWIQLDEWIGPQQTVPNLLVNPLAYPRVSDVDEATDVLPVVGYEIIAELEYVHPSPSPLLRLSPRDARPSVMTTAFG